MRARPHYAIVLLLAGIAQAQVVDRMVAVVNRHVILESELDQATQVEFLLQAKPIERVTSVDRMAVLERLINRSLLDQQIVNPAMLDPAPEELKAKIEEMRQGIPGASTNESWKNILTGYGLTQQDVEEQLTSQFRILRFIDLRFRGLVRIDKKAIAAYYQDRFLPEVRKRNASEPQLSEVSDKIEQILAEQRIDELLNNWLKTLRAQAHIERMLPATAANAGTP
ncbi:MAG TPA: SurA N-terminal domain-containing protein [Candidatus Limnocylindrales bacterium]|nr:SurA N-terminal domain-containing protein [Candidatus Limnocylindrales bacterium]